MRAIGRTDIGLQKSINQDSIFYKTDKIGILPNLFIVADGMGGHKSGDFASQFVVDRLCCEIENYISDNSDIITILNAVISKVDSQLMLKADSDNKYKGMGSTLVLATVIEDELIVANIGDSRLYILMDSLTQITEDHSVVMDLLKKSIITPEQAENHPEKHKITRAMGYGSYPDFYRISINKGDKILLCTDGLTKMVSDNVIEDIIRRGVENFETIVDELIDLANNNGGMDNISAILVDID